MPFCLNGNIIDAFDLTKVLVPFSTCMLVCVTLGFASPAITKYTIGRTQRVALTHKPQESKILELQ